MITPHLNLDAFWGIKISPPIIFLSKFRDKVNKHLYCNLLQHHKFTCGQLWAKFTFFVFFFLTKILQMKSGGASLFIHNFQSGGANFLYIIFFELCLRNVFFLLNIVNFFMELLNRKREIWTMKWSRVNLCF